MPKNTPIRPTSDKARESLFNIIAPRIPGSSFLDLFSGSGAIGLEAISRGASRVVMVELEHIDLIRKNSARCGLTTSGKFHVIRGDVFDALGIIKKNGEKFDHIFADPPWKEKMETKIVTASAGLLKNDGSLIIEAFRKTAPPDGLPGLELASARRYGDTTLLFYKPV